MTVVRVMGNTAGLAVAVRQLAPKPNAGVQPQPDARAFGFRVAVGGYSFTVQVTVSSALLTLLPSESS